MLTWVKMWKLQIEGKPLVQCNQHACSSDHCCCASFCSCNTKEPCSRSRYAELSEQRQAERNMPAGAGGDGLFPPLKNKESQTKAASTNTVACQASACP